MNTSPEKLLAATRSAAEAQVVALSSASDSLLSAVEHLAALNLNTTRAVLDDAIVLGRAAAAVREPKAWFELQLGMIVPALQKSFAYARAVGGIATQARSELLGLAESGVSQSLQGVIATLENLDRNAPAGSATGSRFAAEALKSAVANASSAYDGASQAVKQVSAAAEASADHAATATVDAIDQATKATVTMLKTAA
ncbi:phasin family protein [Thauera chlorobenzoica]|uniref:Uncharacterized protein n=1 Tax=Thauera chlorobenzoica TaxID=96773 RepID=A0A1H5W2A9_9RHOO|nr:phasin family protein [Thauera chlorobenzoica]APR03316.1 hypothetical protein Tchl_0444 [Thauera chlorobenzoica]SEF92947.1 phasin family protein [Thauera chlorobenzoica]